jgi:hypothetical protein
MSRDQKRVSKDENCKTDEAFKKTLKDRLGIFSPGFSYFLVLLCSAVLVVLLIQDCCIGKQVKAIPKSTRITSIPHFISWIPKLPFTKSFQYIVDGNPVTITFHLDYFHSSEHVIKSENQYVVKIDGKRPLGTDGGVPLVEMKSIDIVWAGKKVPVPKELFRNCYQPNFYYPSYWSLIDQKGKGIVFYLEGGSGAGSYCVCWVFRKNGNHMRFDEGLSEL